MWIPKSEEDIEQAIAAGTLIETLTFDAKALPGKSKDIAKDIAAMTVDGGVLLYGVAEDENKRLTQLAPFPLAGPAERIDQIARSSISEPPTYQIHPLQSRRDPALGYLVVVVPASPRAPHMVTVDKELRYYGRSATGNTILGEGEIARLYQRRQHWEQDRAALIEKELQNSPVPPHEDFAYLYLVARPVASDDEFLERVSAGTRLEDTLTGLIKAASAPTVFPNSYSPDFGVRYTWDRTANGFITGMAHNPRDKDQRRPDGILDLKVDFDGTVHLFSGRAGARTRRGLLVLELLIAGLTARFIKFAGALYAAADYYGMVDVGIAIIGLRGGISAHLAQGMYSDDVPIDFNEYRRHGRFLAPDLDAHPRKAAGDLTMRFIRATTRDSYDPFNTKR